MAFEKERAFGIIKIESKSVKLFTSNTSYNSISVGVNIKEARWIGTELGVFLENGKIRKYKTISSYTTIS